MEPAASKDVELRLRLLEKLEEWEQRIATITEKETGRIARVAAAAAALKSNIDQISAEMTSIKDLLVQLDVQEVEDPNQQEVETFSQRCRI
ncbi:hypothetical protein PanWU01x14_367660 [Parasponia andersonii]|uniref:Uncharacterized protein n=1 Tax=Parasponia andersonii TaxID=3476 RepID=A0A2P5A5A1_PARAD|nr:hypothetical protein PanWU01x14_367660 [Parasponia andersonii]